MDKIKIYNLFMLVVFCLLILVSCKKSDNEIPALYYPNMILAGNIDGPGIIYSDTVQKQVQFYYPESDTSFFIDINADGSRDYELRFYGSGSPGHSRSNNSIICYGSNAVAIQAPDPYAKAFLKNDTINAYLSWTTETSIICNYYSDPMETNISGLWYEQTNKFAALRISDGTNHYYGWIQINLTSIWQLTIVDYGCTKAY